MNAQYTVRLYDSSGSCRIEEVCFYFRYVKELYTPYVYFECRFLSSTEVMAEFNRAEFWIYGKLMHCGIIDTIDIGRSNNRCCVSVRSKGFTSLLTQNQPEPGIMKDADLQTVIESCPGIYYVEYENSDAENYIYIKDGSTVWDAVCNLSFRQNGIYPYIESSNKVRITERKPARTVYLSSDDVLESGIRHDLTRLISHIHMQDIDGNYDVYSKTNEAAVSRNIVRHKQIPLDRQFLYSPDSAPDYKLKFSMRGMKCDYVRYAGYNYEDLFDQVTYGSLIKRKIHSVDVMLRNGILTTSLGFYSDGFFSS